MDSLGAGGGGSLPVKHQVKNQHMGKAWLATHMKWKENELATQPRLFDSPQSREEVTVAAKPLLPWGSRTRGGIKRGYTTSAILMVPGAGGIKVAT